MKNESKVIDVTPYIDFPSDEQEAEAPCESHYASNRCARPGKLDYAIATLEGVITIVIGLVVLLFLAAILSTWLPC